MDIKWHSSDETHMQVREKNGVTFLTYPAFENLPEIIHCFSTRLGGVSEGIFSSMNLSFTRGDNENAVKENYRRLGAAVGFAPEDVVSSDQTHTTNVRLVGAEDRGNGITRPRTFHDTDGMITNVPGVVLATYYADCVPLYFVDPVHHAIGLSHSGWRGTVGKIGKVTIEKMHQEFGSDPAELLTAIGPSICQDCYEVSEDVILEFQNAFNEKYWNRLFYKKDQWKVSAESLGSQPHYFPGSRNPGGTHFHAWNLHLLQSRFSLFPSCLPRQTRQPGCLPWNSQERKRIIPGK